MRSTTFHCTILLFFFILRFFKIEKKKSNKANLYCLGIVSVSSSGWQICMTYLYNYLLNYRYTFYAFFHMYISQKKYFQRKIAISLLNIIILEINFLLCNNQTKERSSYYVGHLLEINLSKGTQWVPTFEATNIIMLSDFSMK